jgi:hypothetical protein
VDEEVPLEARTDAVGLVVVVAVDEGDRPDLGPLLLEVGCKIHTSGAVEVEVVLRALIPYSITHGSSLPSK